MDPTMLAHRRPARQLTDSNRNGSVSRSAMAMLLSLLILTGLAMLLMRPPPSPSHSTSNDSKPSEPLVIYCAASNKSVLEAIRKDYERDYKTLVQVQLDRKSTRLNSSHRT